MTPQQWICVLKLSEILGFRTFVDLALNKLEKCRNELDPIDGILWGAKYRIASWFATGCMGLARREDGVSVEDAEKLGTKTVLQIYKLREMLRQTQSHPNKRQTLQADMTNVVEKMYIEAIAEGSR